MRKHVPHIRRYVWPRQAEFAALKAELGLLRHEAPDAFAQTSPGNDG